MDELKKKPKLKIDELDTKNTDSGTEKNKCNPFRGPSIKHVRFVGERFHESVSVIHFPKNPQGEGSKNRLCYVTYFMDDPLILR